MTTAAKNATKLLKLFGPKGEHWVTKNSAVDSKGKMVRPLSRQAVRWCLIGGLDKHNMDMKWMYDALGKRQLGGSIATFNDRRKFPSIKKFLEDIVENGS